MAEKKSIWAQLKARLATDSVDVNDEKIYKNVRGGPGGGRDFRKPRDAQRG